MPRRTAHDVLNRHDERVAQALAKREAGEELTRNERYLLAAEDVNLSPEAIVSLLAQIATKPKRRAGSQVRALDSLVRLLGDEAPKKIDAALGNTLGDLIRAAGGDGEVEAAAGAAADPEVPAQSRPVRNRSARRKTVAGAGTGRKKGRRKNQRKTRR